MKIAILTHPLISNYGGILQAYALSHYLKKLGHDSLVLNRQSNISFISRYIKIILMSLNYPRYKNPKYRNIAKFIKEHINYSQPLWTTRELNLFLENNNVDAVVVGSDQVWRTDFAMDYGYDYFLNFAYTNIKKFSYAASFGLSEWKYTNEQTSIIKNLLNTFSAISVREDEAVELCRTHLEIDAKHVLDPTLLLTIDDYEPIISERLVKDDYVFVYWLGSEDEKKSAIEKIRLTNKKIVDVSLRCDDVLIPIENWLSYIKCADIVITDSFHGCVFALLFHKQIILSKNDSGGNGRLMSLFKMFELEMDNNVIDYEKFERILQEERQKSYKFIKEAL